MNKKLIIGSIYGGLGDHLQFSTIPYLASQYGIECYVSNQTRYHNPDIKRLVWDLNPYVKFTDESPNLTEQNYKYAIGNIISDWEIQLFATAKNRVPRIYYTPSKYNQAPNKYAYVEDRIVIDPNGISNKVNFQPVINKYRSTNPIVLNPSITDNLDLEGCEVIYTKDIFEWVDYIISSKGFICQNSGGAVVAAAYKKMAEIYMKDADMADNVFRFDMHYYASIESLIQTNKI